ncbi:cytochrome c peroxidase [uncultured Cytophaga sp.]|uniref:cytochrome-c peroxidase n=1 Tax=uncultured Cytophaga sp. TaxID=160238 RepID=UPI002622B5F8|nr:cytochrome c peroxidase [uncultured Cytophaga sp.]
MKKNITLIILVTTLIVSIAFIFKPDSNDVADYQTLYSNRIKEFKQKQIGLVSLIDECDLSNEEQLEKIKIKIQQTRVQLKGIDFWLRYLEPISYKKINGPLPVEWETEVFEKHEAPYKREAAGLTLAYLYIEEDEIDKIELKRLIQESVEATDVYLADSITKQLDSYHHFYLCNRLYLLNLAAIYTTGFECPDTELVLPELLSMLKDVQHMYGSYNKRFPSATLNDEYLNLYKKTIEFVFNQSSEINAFDHFTFIQQYVNPLYVLNQKMILEYKVSSKSMVDYSLNKNSTSIFDKDLYYAQNAKGVFSRVSDTVVLKEINDLGKLLFYDPILSGNNMRSCASCHLPTQYFTDTINQTALQFNRVDRLPRNTPSLLNVRQNHLLMLDGAHSTMQNQAKGVMVNPVEMGSTELEALQKVLNCKEYTTRFTKLLKYTPQEKEITVDHLTAALTIYYTKFSNSYAPFDEAMIEKKPIDPMVQEGFNLFMGKAQCATCHFVPQFNGVKPPYVNSEFEVIGVPKDNLFTALSTDNGRSSIYPSDEMKNAFRTGSIRNASYTKPYMHNGVFNNLTEVIEFYNNGGGVGRGLTVLNQTLSSDSLQLTPLEIKKIVVFIEALNEKITFENPPVHLPVSKDKMLLERKVGGIY